MSQPPTLILETAVYASDLNAAEAFYGGLLGLERIVRSGERHVFYRCGSGILLIFNPDATEVADTRSPWPVPPHGARGPGHLCFAAEPIGLEAWKDRLVAAGIAIEAELRWPSGGRSFYFRDPAGNSLEIAEARIWGSPS
ncbi:VOC family protein [Rubellimicrobium arenae]|uniref:VOC family protein n=1 Tax=Rubellimicrobium arenae TaxID=2817372 RepID=UPI001B306F6F|nr:VOC family protein [Rubellimicrobium arenae]